MSSAPVDEDNRTYDELIWTSLQPFLRANGYEMRARYQPGMYGVLGMIRKLTLQQIGGRLGST